MSVERQTRDSWRYGTALLAAGLLLAMIRPGAVRAQEAPAPSPAASARPLPTAVPAAVIAERAEDAMTELRELRSRLVADPAVGEIGRSLQQMRADLQRLSLEPKYALRSGLTLRDVEDARQQWAVAATQLEGWSRSLVARAQAVESGLAEVRDLDELWKTTAAAAEAERLPAAVRDRIASVRGAIREADAQLREQRNLVLTLQTTLASEQAMVTDQMTLADDAGARLRRSLFAIDGPPLWTVLLGLPEGEPLGAVARKTWTQNTSVARAFLQRSPQFGVVLGVILLAALALLLDLRRRSSRWPQGDEDLAAAIQLATRPFAAAILIALLLTLVWNPGIPRPIVELAKLLLVLPVVRILQGAPFTPLRPLLKAFVTLLFLDALRNFLPPSATVARLWLAAETLAIALWPLAYLRPARLDESGITGAWQRALVAARRLALVLLAISLAANVIGAVSLAVLLTQGTLHSANAAIVLYTARLVFGGIVVGMLRFLRRLRAVQHHAALLRRRAVAVVRALALLGWIVVVLSMFSLLWPVTRALRAALAATLTVGSVSLSLGAVVSFVLTVCVAFLLGCFVRVLLEEDVLPRFALPRRTATAISTVTHYAMMLVGVLFAIAAAGIDLGRVTVVVGALGVGIGFGLQSIVNNFFSGLILIFERPIQVGDTIELGDLTGEVTHIGIRSSRLRTVEGAEVIVPNGTLIAEKVVNWTLSDHQRRIEIRVGVAYGTEPARVFELLLGVARAHSETLQYPPPTALFLGFGESALDFVLRTWTTRQDAFHVVRSEMAVAVYEALTKAGIEIPFPQRDVHVRSVDSAIRDAPTKA